MSDTNSQEEIDPKTQLETARGGSGRNGSTAIGAGSGDDSERPNRDWPDDPNLGYSPRTVIVEKDDLLRSGLKAMIATFVSIVAEVSNSTDALEAIRQFDPELVILNVDLYPLNGLGICRQIYRRLLNTKFLIYTNSHFATKYYHQLSRTDVRVFCLQSSGPRALFEGIKQVTSSLPYCDPKLQRLLKQSPSGNNGHCNLTDREIEVLVRVELSNSQISEELDMKMRTVEKHIECILIKLNVSTREAAALKALEFGYESLPKTPERDAATGKLIELITAEEYAKESISRQSLRNKLSY